MGKGSGSQKSQTVQSSQPWSGVQPYLTGAFKDLQGIYNKGAPSYYPNQTVADMSGYTRGALDSMAQRGAAGSPLTDQAQQSTMDTLHGNYLNSNPSLQGAINAAIRPVTDTFQNVTMPGIASNFSSAGRYGSGALGGAMTQAQNGLLNQVGDISSNMAYQNYNDERARMMQAGLLAPELANQDYKDIGAIAQAGQGLDTYNQALINADIQKYNYGQNAPWNFANDYISALGGAPGPTTTTTQQGPQPSWASNLFGGALTGAGLGNMVGINPLFGAIGGGLLSGLFG